MRRWLWWIGFFMTGHVLVALASLSRWWTIPCGFALGVAGCLLSLVVQRKAASSPTESMSSLTRDPEQGGLPWGVILHAGHGAGGRASAASRATTTRWRQTAGLEWLEFPEGSDPGRLWGEIGTDVLAKRSPRAFRGAVIIVEAASLLDDKDEKLAVSLNPIRAWLTEMAHTGRSPIPVHLLVSGIDRLYGMPSLARRLPPDRLRRPLGSVCHAAASQCPGAVKAITVSVAETLFSEALRTRNASPAPQWLQAPDEIIRLAEPLGRCCEGLFRGEASGQTLLSGIFFFAGAREAPPLPPRMPSLAAFQPMAESMGPSRPWFTESLLGHLMIGGPVDPDSGAAEPAVCRAVWWKTLPVAAALAFSLLVLGAYRESRAVLLSVPAGPVAPTRPEELASLRDQAARVRAMAAAARFPRFGLTHSLRLAAAMESRFAQGFHNLRTVPGLDRLQELALRAARSGDPRALGESLLRLGLVRSRLARAVHGKGRSGDTPVETIVRALHLTDDQDLKQWDAYLDWTDSREWMPAAEQTLDRFQTYLIRQGDGGSLAWLPAWIDSLPHLRAVETDRLWGEAGGALPSPVASRIAPAWTVDGYRFARRFVEYLPAQGGTEAWRDACEEYFAAYRGLALRRWQEAAGVLWQCGAVRGEKAGLAFLLDTAASPDDPASAFISLANRHLVPIFEGEEEPPAIRWLRLQAGEESAGDAVLDGARESFLEALGRIRGICRNPTDTLAAIRSAYRESAAPVADRRRDPYSEAIGHALSLDARLRARSGGQEWDSLSFRSRVEFLRFLGLGLAAHSLDSAWREEVYAPSRLVPGDERERAASAAGADGTLHRFLGRTAMGLWQWEAGQMHAAAWDGLAFPFSPAFLHWAGSLLEKGFAPPPRSVTAPFTVEAVSVDPEARERPVEVEFLLRTGDGTHCVAYRNTRMASEFTFSRQPPEAAVIRVHFPAASTSLSLDGPEGFQKFLTLFGTDGQILLPADSFDDPMVLLRRGIRQVAVRASLSRVEEIRAFLEEGPGLPPSIVSFGIGDLSGTADAPSRPGRTAGSDSVPSPGPYGEKEKVDPAAIHSTASTKRALDKTFALPYSDGT